MVEVETFQFWSLNGWNRELRLVVVALIIGNRYFHISDG
jgi:hypothetical protein